MIMQGCVITCGTVLFFQKSRNLSQSLLTNNNFYCADYHDKVSLKLPSQRKASLGATKMQENMR